MLESTELAPAVHPIQEGDERQRIRFLIGESIRVAGDGNLHRSLDLAAQALSLAQVIGDDYGLLWGELRLCVVGTLGIGPVTENAELFQRADHIISGMRRIGDQYGEARALVVLGTIKTRLGEVESAILSCFTPALEYARRSENARLEAVVLNDCSLAHIKLGSLDQALDCLLRSYAIHKELGQSSEAYRVLNNIADIYGALGEHVKAAELLFECLQYAQENNVLDQIPMVRGNITSQMIKLGRPDEAIAYAEDAREFNLQLGYREEGLWSLCYISRGHQQLGQREQALAAAEQAIGEAQLHPQHPSPGYVEALRLKGELLEEAGMLREAARHFGRAREVAEALQLRLEEENTHRDLARLHGRLGEFEPALRHTQAAARLRQTRDENELQRRLTAERVRFETERAEREAGHQRQRAADLEAAMAQLHESEGLLRTAFEDAPVGMALIDARGVVTRANPPLLRLLDRPPSEVLGQAVWALGDAEQEREQELFAAARAGGQDAYQIEKRWVGPGGRATWVVQQVALVRNPAGELQSGICHLLDLTRRKEAEDRLAREEELLKRERDTVRRQNAELAEANLALRAADAQRAELFAQLAHQAEHDALTGLPNAVGFERRLQDALAEARRSGHALAVVSVDLSRIKQLQAYYGREAGNAIFAEVSRRLQHACAGGGQVARLATEEFAVLLAPLGHQDEARQWGQRLLGLLLPPEWNGIEFPITPYLGVATFPYDAGDARTLMRHADTARSHARSAGESGVVHYARRMARRLPSPLEVEERLRGAMRGEVPFQTEVQADPGTLRPLGYALTLGAGSGGRAEADWEEVLAQTADPQLLGEFGAWLLRGALERAGELPDFPGRTVALAVPSALFELPNFASLVEEVMTGLLQTPGHPPVRLELEVREAALLGRPEHTAQTLWHLRGLGLGVVLGDFGQGFSNLKPLRALNVHGFKLHPNFLPALSADAGTRPLAEAVCTFARMTGGLVIGTGVSAPRHLDAARALGCERVQGPLIPLPAGGPPTPPAPSAPLSAREVEVLALLAAGHSNKAIAGRLGISQHTVRYHVSSLFSKLEVRSRAQAVSCANQLGLLSGA